VSDPRLSLGAKILIGVLIGIVCGVVLGELTAPLAVVGTIYVALLQMTVLPYVTVSLVERIGSLTLARARQLAGQAGLVLAALWAIALVAVLVMPLSLPDWSTGSFFSSSLVERPNEFDLLGLYLPSNPFHALANNIVPAVVLFSILLGIALIGVPQREQLLRPLGVLSASLSRISGFVVRLAPLGTLALAADAAGTLSPDALIRLAGYVSTYTLAVVLLSFVIVPAFAAATTPLRYRTLVRGMAQSTLAAFATGKLFAVLPMIISDSSKLLRSQDVEEAQAQSMADLFVPLGYPFPNAGKILALLFIPFAAWFNGTPLELSQYPLLLSVGVFAFFGSPVAAIPFLLDLMRLPIDMLPLFLISGIWCARVGDVLGAVHLTTFTVLSASASLGRLRWQAKNLLVWALIASCGGASAVWLNHTIVASALRGHESGLEIVDNLELYNQLTEIVVDQAVTPNPQPLAPDESREQRIRRTGEMRVGFVPDIPPFSYRGTAGHPAGLDVDLIHRLAADLDATLRLIPITREGIGAALDQDVCDIAVGGIASTIRSFGSYRESAPYLEAHAALIVRDHQVKDFSSIAAIRALGDVRLGYEAGGLFVRAGRYIMPSLEVVEIPSVEAFVDGEVTDVDAVLTTAESGAVLTMVHPEFSVVIPSGFNAKVALVFAVPRTGAFGDLVDTWIRTKRDDDMLTVLYKHWVLGQGATEEDGPRWSVVRDVFGWVK